MLIQLFMLAYRLLAIVVLIIPVVVNIFIKGDIVVSLIYIPSLILLLSLVLIYVDQQLSDLLASLNLRNMKKKTRDIARSSSTTMSTLGSSLK